MVWANVIKIGKGNFCSRRCAQDPPVEKKCRTCGKKFMVWANVIKIGKGNFCSRRCNLLTKRSVVEQILVAALDARSTVSLGPYFVDIIEGRTAIEYDGFAYAWKVRDRSNKFRRKRRLAHKLGYKFVIVRYDDVKDALVRQKDGSYIFYAPHVVQELLEVRGRENRSGIRLES